MKTHPTRVMPSILSAPFDELAGAIRPLEESGMNLLHFDVMDGHFVPNITIGPLIIKSLEKAVSSAFDVHLMVSNHTVQAGWFDHPRVTRITFHQEVSNDMRRDVKQIQAMGKEAGVSIKPATPVEVLQPVLDVVDQILIMTVNPGFGGQRFMPDMVTKIEWLVKQRETNGFDFRIQVDGGINADTIQQVYDAGVDEFVAGSAIFGDENPVKAYRELCQTIGAAF